MCPKGLLIKWIRSVLTSFFTCTYHTSLEQQPARRLEAASAPIQRSAHTCTDDTTYQRSDRLPIGNNMPKPRAHERAAPARPPRTRRPSPQLLRPPHAHLQPARQPLHAASHLDDAPAAHDGDLVGVADGAQPARDHDGRALRLGHDLVQRRLHDPLALVVQRARRLVEHRSVEQQSAAWPLRRTGAAETTPETVAEAAKEITGAVKPGLRARTCSGARRKANSVHHWAPERSSVNHGAVGSNARNACWCAREHDVCLP
jgi:hypothetical protein